MSGEPVREEVLNVLLAQLLEQRGLLSIPENIRRSFTGERRLPDVMVTDLHGVRVVIEGRIGIDPGTKASLFKRAKSRVEEGIAPICVAVLYPNEARSGASVRDLSKRLAGTQLGLRVVTEGSEGDWTEASIDGLADLLRRGYEVLVSEDVVETGVARLEAAIEKAATYLAGVPASSERIKALLGIPAEPLTPKGGRQVAG